MLPFAKILDLCLTLSRDMTDIVFIGGVAVYLHSARRSLAAVTPETSHDADFMISFSDYGALKDAEEITATPRLAKHQMIVDGIEFDIYVERLHQLVVPYDEVIAHGTIIEQIRVAALEHLLILKLEAFAKRGHSGKGMKDRRDIAKIGLLLGRRSRKSLIQPYMREDLAELLREMVKSQVFIELSSRSQEAKKARVLFAAFVSDVT